MDYGPRTVDLQEPPDVVLRDPHDQRQEEDQAGNLEGLDEPDRIGAPAQPRFLVAIKMSAA